MKLKCTEILADNEDSNYEKIYPIVKDYVATDKFNKAISLIKDEILKKIKDKLGFSADTEIKRDYDGNSQLDWLVEKMVGEFLAEEKIKW